MQNWSSGIVWNEDIFKVPSFNMEEPASEEEALVYDYSRDSSSNSSVCTYCCAKVSFFNSFFNEYEYE